MEKLRIAVVGYGNIGRYTVQALQAAPDMEIAGIVRRNGAADKPAELADYKVVKDITEAEVRQFDRVDYRARFPKEVFAP